MIQKYGLGLDGGNTKVKGVTFINKVPITLTLPSVSTDGSIANLANARRAVGNNDFDHDEDCLDKGEYILKVKGGSQRFIGDLASKEDRQASSGLGDPNRYWSSRMIEYALTCAGIAIQDHEFELYVVGGLPAGTFAPETCNKYIKNLLGSYTFTLYGKENHLDSRERRCSIVDVKVLREGAGASLTLAQKDGGIQGFIDIGGYSTDLYACDGFKPIGKMCTGIDIGVENITDLINNWYKDEYHVDADLSAKQRAEILKAAAHPLNFLYPTISVNRRVISSDELQNWTHAAIDIVGQRINEHIVRSWKSGEKGLAAVDFNKVYVVGGGAYTLTEQINKIIPNTTRTQQPELQNVLGYAIYGNQIAQRAEKIA